ncbi:MAG: hypothetical protein ACE14M_08955 [Terriglobales bacterium]
MTTRLQPVLPGRHAVRSAVPIKIGDTSTPVVVVGLDTHGPLGIMRSLGRLGVDVYAVHSRSRMPSQFSRYCKGFFYWNFPDGGADALLQNLLDVSRAVGGRPILVPTSDETVVFVNDHLPVLREPFLYPGQTAALVRSLISKKEMYFLAKRHGIPTAETLFPQTRAEVVQFAARVTFPLMLKGIDGTQLARRTGTKMVIVHSARELLEKYDALEDTAAPNLMLQEYIPGEDDTVWMFNGYFNHDSDCLFGITGKKIRQHPVARGITSLGVCLTNEIVGNTTRRFMKEIGYRGILDIGYRYDARDGNYKVLDINPRIGCTFRLFLAQNGLDVIRAMYLDLTGQSVPQAVPREGRRWLVELPDLKSTIEYFRLGKLSFTQWLRSFRGVEETGYFAMDDLRPFWKMIASAPLRAIRQQVAKTPMWTPPPKGRLVQHNSAVDATGDSSCVAPSSRR